MIKSNEVLGKILWWSSRDENGVICDAYGNEYYFDRSVVGPKQLSKLERGSLVIFEASRCDNILVAKGLKIPTDKYRPKYEEAYSAERNQLCLPFAT